MVNDQLNEVIVRAIGLYRVATRASVAAILPEGGEPDKRIAKLVKDGLLRAHKGLAGNRTVYQLTKKGASVAGVSPARGRPAGGQSLLKNVGVLLFCHVPGTERHRVEAEELGKALGVTLPDGAYCLCRHKEKAFCCECYVPGPHTPVPTVAHHLGKRIKAARQDPTLSEAVKDLRYAFAVIVPSKPRRKAVMDAVRTVQPGERIPLIKRARIFVDAVEELGALFGSAGPRLRNDSGGAAQATLFEH